MVPPTRARASQSSSSSFPGSSWPVTTVKAVATDRWVTGIPAPAGTDIAEVTPGTTSKGTFAAARASPSSPPLPKTKGSPPFSRTTIFPSLPFSTRRALIFSWVSLWRPGSFPTSIISAPSPAHPRISGERSRSKRITSASSRSRLAFSVKSSGSPGPAPTSHTFPHSVRSNFPHRLFCQIPSAHRHQPSGELSCPPKVVGGRYRFIHPHIPRSVEG